MQGEPSPNLVALLERLKLATRAQILAVAPAARRLGDDLPDFEPVWVDALAQARVLTPLQAAEINGGRGDELLQGPYQIARKLSGPGYAECYAARHTETRRAARLYLVRRPQVPAVELARSLAAWVDASRPLVGSQACVVEESGVSGEAVWATSAAVEGIVAADWLVENGRLPPNVVLEIARQMVAQLATLEHHSLVHGDISATAVVLHKSGRAVLPMPGLRGLVRPAEGYSFCDLQPEAFASLSPERIAEGLPPSVSSDLYACGTLWWHLLTGRSPLAGGNSLLKLKAIHASKLLDVRHLAPDVPETLAQAIHSVTMSRGADRPESFAKLAEMIGTPTRVGAAQLARCVNRPTQVWQPPRRRGRRPQQTAPLRAAPTAIVATLLLTLAGLGVYAQRTSGHRSTPKAEVASAVQPARSPQASNVAARKTTPNDELLKKTAVASASPVRLASATELPNRNTPDPLVLPSGKTTLRRGLALQPGQCVRGKEGQRPTISVPRGGLVVAREDTRFEGIDFVWEHEPDRSAAGRQSAMLMVEAQAIEFRGCSFSAPADSPIAAIALAGGTTLAATDTSEFTMIDCVFHGTSAVVDCLASPNLAVQMKNTLCLSSGPMLRLHRAPRADEAATITLDHVTARGNSPALECRAASDAPAGPMSICATDCVFDTSAGLLVFWGVRPSQALASLTWTGHGSLVTPDTSMAVWAARGKSPQPLEEDAIDIAGLARCQVQFAASLDGPLGASRITEWQGPLRSSDPPGARVHALSLVTSKSNRATKAESPSKR